MSSRGRGGQSSRGRGGMFRHQTQQHHEVPATAAAATTASSYNAAGPQFVSEQFYPSQQNGKNRDIQRKNQAAPKGKQQKFVEVQQQAPAAAASAPAALHLGVPLQTRQQLSSPRYDTLSTTSSEVTSLLSDQQAEEYLSALDDNVDDDDANGESQHASAKAISSLRRSLLSALEQLKGPEPKDDAELLRLTDRIVPWLSAVKRAGHELKQERRKANKRAAATATAVTNTTVVAQSVEAVAAVATLPSEPGPPVVAQQAAPVASTHVPTATASKPRFVEVKENEASTPSQQQPVKSALQVAAEKRAAASAAPAATAVAASTLPATAAPAIDTSKMSNAKRIQNLSAEDIAKIQAQLQTLVAQKRIAEAVALIGREIHLDDVPREVIFALFKSLEFPRELPQVVADKVIEIFMECLTLKKYGKSKDKETFLQQERSLLVTYNRFFGIRQFADMMRNINAITLKNSVKLSNALPKAKDCDYFELLRAQSCLSILAVGQPKLSMAIIKIYDSFYQCLMKSNVERTLALHQAALEGRISTKKEDVVIEEIEPSQQEASLQDASAHENGDANEDSEGAGDDELADEPPVSIWQLEEAPSKPVSLGSANTAALTAEADIIYMELRPSDEEDKSKQLLRDEINSIAQTTLKQDVRVHMYGSSASGFGLRGADIDLCIKFPSEKIGLDPKIQGKFLKQLHSAINDAKTHYPNLHCHQEPVLSSRVPVLKVSDTARKFEADLCVGNYLGVLNTQMLREYSLIDPRVRPLVYVIKHWAKRRHINDPPSGTLSSYSYVLMVIFYLQQLDTPILPSLQALAQSDKATKADVSYPETYSTYDCRYFKNIAKLKEIFQGNQHNDMSLGELIVGFFDFYVNRFSMSDQTVNIRIGKATPKMTTQCIISIEDPFERRDLGGVITPTMQDTFVAEFSRAFDILSRGGSLSEIIQERSKASSEVNIYERREDYEEHLDEQQVLQLLEQGKLHRGVLRVNKKRFFEAFVSVEGVDKDILIDGFKARNRAIHGDVVAIKIDEVDEEQVHVAPLQDAKSTGSPEEVVVTETRQTEYALVTNTGETVATVKSNKIRLGTVVYVLEKKSPRLFTCRLMRQDDAGPGKGFRWLLPIDKSYPKIMVDYDQFRNLCNSNATYLDELLFVVEINSPWKVSHRFPKGRLVATLGLKHDLHAQKRAIAVQYMPQLYECIFAPENKKKVQGKRSDQKQGKQRAPASLTMPSTRATLQAAEYQVSDIEVDMNDPEIRRDYQDYRDKRVFTIDPTSSRDLDDALSIERLPNGQYRIYVYVADVCRFVKEGDDIDLDARSRGTSVYMIDVVEHMLDPYLSANMCSILPGVTRFSVGVEFTMDSDAHVVPGSINFFRAVIQSKCRLDYDQAQLILEGKEVPSRPAVKGGFTWYDIQQDVADFHLLAQKLRKRRQEGGSLFLSNVELYFGCNEDGFPMTCETSDHSESHQLIEEFMLKANELTAQALYDHFKEDAFVRAHPEPNLSSWRILSQTLARGIQQRHAQQQSRGGKQLSDDDYDVIKLMDQKDWTMQQVMTYLVSLAQGDEDLVATIQNCYNKEMQLAKYHRVGDFETVEGVHHYALNAPLYTHFTSPIRRYADLIVHRQVLAMLQAKKQGRQLGHLSEDMRGEKLSEIAKHLNDMNYAAKTVQDHCVREYLAFHLLAGGKDGNLSTRVERVPGVVVSLGRRSFTVYIPKYGIEVMCNVMKEFVPIPDEVKEVDRNAASASGEDQQQQQQQLQEEEGDDHSKNADITSLTLQWNKSHETELSTGGSGVQNYPRSIELLPLKTVLVDIDVDFETIPYDVYVYNVWESNQQLHNPLVSRSVKYRVHNAMKRGDASTLLVSLSGATNDVLFSLDNLSAFNKQRIMQMRQATQAKYANGGAGASGGRDYRQQGGRGGAGPSTPVKQQGSFKRS